MDRFTHLRRLLPVWVGLLAIMLASNSLNAQLQCNLQYNAAAPGGPYNGTTIIPTIELELNATNGTVVLNSAVVLSSGFFTSDCPLTGANVRFYQGSIFVGTSIPLDCDDIASGSVLYTISVRTATRPLSIELPVYIKVVDDTAPQVTCPDNVINVPADASCIATGIMGIGLSYVAPASYTSTAGTYTDNCTSNTVSWSIGATTGTGDAGMGNFQKGTNTVTYKVTDASMLSATCTFTVNVVDVTAPTFTVPSDVTIDCQDPTDPFDMNGNTGTPTNLADNCSAVSYLANHSTFTDVVTPGSCPQEKTIARTWMVTDEAGNTTTAATVQTITVIDQDAPNIRATVLPAVSLNYTGTDLSCTVSHTITLTAADVTDNCTDFADFSITWSVDYPSTVGIDRTVGGTSLTDNFPIGTTTITLTVTDQCGEASSKTIRVRVTDRAAPIINEPFANSLGNTQNLCGRTINIVNSSGNCGNTFSWYRPWVTSGDFGDCDLFTVTEVASNPSVQSSINSYAVFNYNTGAPLDVRPTIFFPVGSTTITYTATDDNGNSSVCSFTVDVEDTQDPVLTCPTSPVTLGTICAGTPIPDYRGLISISDNCPSSVNLTQSPLQGSDIALVPGLVLAANNTFPVTITGQDQDNIVTCTFTVRLTDSQAPIPTITNLPAVNSRCGTFTLLAPTATDPCNLQNPIIYGTPSTPIGSFSASPTPRYTLNTGNYVITWIYNDNNGNLSSQVQNVNIVADVFPPVALCKKNVTVNLATTSSTTGTPPVTTTTTSATVTAALVDSLSNDPDMCGALTRTVTPSTFGCNNIQGTNIVTLTVTDLAGNTATCTSRITVKDATPPVLSAVPAPTTISCGAPIPAAANVTATDECSTPTVSLVETSTRTASGCGRNSYAITRTWTASDASGNTVSGQQVITVTDVIPPLFASNAPSSVVVYTDGTRVTCNDTVVLNITPFVTDCSSSSDITITNSLTPSLGGNITGIYPVGTNNTVVFTATDACGNSSTKSVVISVLDGTAPVAACINGISVTIGSSGVIALPASVFSAGSFDNCSPPAPTIDVRRNLTGTAFGPGVNFTCADADGSTQHGILLRATDAAGNTAVCSTYVVVQDNVAPILTCPVNKTISCTESTAVTAQGNATVTDNCSSNLLVAFSDATTAGTGGVCTVLTRTFRVSDNAGNTATCRQVISINDNQAPVLSATPANITVSCSSLPVPVPTVTATDNCSTGLTVGFAEAITNPATGACGNYDYILRRTWSATDACGNVGVHTQFITVKDNTAPAFTGAPANLTVNSADSPANTTCTVPVTLNIGQYITDCATAAHTTVTNNAPTGIGNGGMNASGNYPVGVYTIRFTATDACGNTGTHTVNLTVKDNSIPTMICQDAIVVALGSQGTATLAISTVDRGSYDNCSIVNRVLSPNTFDCGDLGLNVISLTATDNSGNTNSCLISVDVTQGTASVFTLATTGSTTAFYGASNGTASATPTGGTGNFVYAWSTGATTSSISGLTAGSYTVTVTDNGSQCRRIATVVVNQGPKLTIIAGTAAGAQGTMVEIPVTAQQFNAVQSMQFSLHVTDAAVATVVGVTAVNPALTVPGAGFFQSNVSGNNIGILWADTSVVGVTLPANTVLFNIKVNLVGAANTSSPVTLDSIPVDVEFIQNLSGVSTLSPVVLTNGTVLVNNGAVLVNVAGDIQTWSLPNRPVANVTVNLTGSQTITQQTLANGLYSFNTVNSGDNTSVSCTKVTAGNDKITSGDLLGIVNHIFGTVPFASPYQWIAADVNFSGSVTLADYLRIQKLVLGSVQHIEGIGASDWRFVPKSYVFPTPPLSAPIPSSISHNPALTDYLDDDFVAVRYGDVNGNTPVTLTHDGSEERYGNDDVFKFRLDEQSFNKGQLVTIPVRASDFKNRQAYQMTMSFDPTVLALEDVKTGALPNLSMENFGTSHLSEGYLTTVWVNRNAVSLQNDEVLFTLTFKALKSSMALSNVFSAGSQVTASEAIDEEGNTQKVDFEYILPTSGGNVEAQVFNLYQNQPNPFRGETIIGFRLPEQSKATLRIFNTSGQLVRTVDREFEKGYNEVRFKSTELGSAGIYWYELETPTHSDRKKMVIIE